MTTHHDHDHDHAHEGLAADIPRLLSRRRMLGFGGAGLAALLADAKGVLEFTSVCPAAYSGRWPHIHFEVYPDLKTATSAGTKLRTTQLALPEAICNTVYATTGYEASVRNMSSTSLTSDNVFSDGVTLQLAEVTGSVTEGYVASLTVPI